MLNCSFIKFFSITTVCKTIPILLALIKTNVGELLRARSKHIVDCWLTPDCFVTGGMAGASGGRHLGAHGQTDAHHPRQADGPHG